MYNLENQITATEAYTATKRNIDTEELKDIYDKIRKAIKNKKFYIEVENLNDITKKELEEQGYIIKESDLVRMEYYISWNLKDKVKVREVASEEMNNRREYNGIDMCGEYVYYDIIDYKTCCTCEHFHDNWYEERFECCNKECDKLKKR